MRPAHGSLAKLLLDVSLLPHDTGYMSIATIFKSVQPTFQRLFASAGAYTPAGIVAQSAEVVVSTYRTDESA